MYNNTAVYIFNRVVRLAILFFILYLIFTNFGTFLMILGIIFVVIAFSIYNFRKKMQTNSFKFKFESSNFQNGNNGQNFNFNDFKNFNQSDFQGFTNAPRFDEVAKAKEFFGFTQNRVYESKTLQNCTPDFHCTFIGGGFRGCVFEQLLYTGIHQCVACYVYSKCACLRLLSASIQHDRGLRDDRRTRNRK